MDGALRAVFRRYARILIARGVYLGFQIFIIAIFRGGGRSVVGSGVESAHDQRRSFGVCLHDLRGFFKQI